ncbi:MAG: Ig-like domain-containing protein [Pirellulaceae bacterium]
MRKSRTARFEFLESRKLLTVNYLDAGSVADSSTELVVAGIDVNADRQIDLVSFGASSVVWRTNSSGEFGSPITIANVSAADVVAVDFDADGDTDLLTSSVVTNGLGEIAWYSNGDGAAGFGAKTSLIANVNVSDIELADLDGDGDRDLIGLRSTDMGAELFWAANQNGSLQLPTVTIDVFSSQPRNLKLGDIDGDGDIDVLGWNNDTFQWWANNGSGIFGDSQLAVDLEGAQVSEPRLVDLNNDDALDLLYSSIGTLYWHANNQSNTSPGFGPAQTIRETSAVLAATAPIVVDADADDDQDIIALSTTGNQVVSIENLGDGTFSPEQVLLENFSFPSKAITFSIDNDADQDLLVSGLSGTRILTNQLHQPALEEVSISIGAQSVVIYDRATGSVRLETATPIRTLEILSREARFVTSAAENLGGEDDIVRIGRIFKSNDTGFTDISFGNILPTGLSDQDVIADLVINGRTLANQIVANHRVEIDLQLVDQNDQPVTVVNVGDSFFLKAVVNDNRSGAIDQENLGVLAAYFDVSYAGELVTATVPRTFQFSPAFPNSRSGNFGQGRFDEVGAQADANAEGTRQAELFRISMQATNVGTVTFIASPAGDLPAHDVFLFGVDDAIGEAEVDYQTVSLAITQPTPGPVDPTEPNDTVGTAFALPSATSVRHTGSQIESNTDQDVFRYVPPTTGWLEFDLATRAEVAGGVLMEVLNRDQQVVRVQSGTISAGSQSFRVTLPVVQNQPIYFRISGANPFAYTLDLANRAAVVPRTVSLAPASDTGASPTDRITRDATPRLLIQADLTPMGTAGVALLGSLAANDGTQEGAAVEVTLTNLETGNTYRGFADRLSPTSLLYAYTPSEAVPDGDYFVTSQVRVFAAERLSPPDPLPQLVNGAGADSAATSILVDTVVPCEEGDGTDYKFVGNDSGRFNADGVTRTSQLLFSGRAEADAYVNLRATDVSTGLVVYVGSPRVSNDLADGVEDGFGVWNLTTPALSDGVYQFQIEVGDAAGNRAFCGDTVRIEIDTDAPRFPQFVLLDNADQPLVGDTQRISRPKLAISVDDVTESGHLFADNLRYRVIDRFNGTAEVVLYDSSRDNAVTAITDDADDLTDLNELTIQLPDQAFTLDGESSAVMDVDGQGVLRDGLHAIVLEVVDRAGNIVRTERTSIRIDTSSPRIYFGTPDSDTDGLAANSDSGILAAPQTFADRLTNERFPEFYGMAQPGSLVQLYVVKDAKLTDDPLDDSVELIGQTTVPDLAGSNDNTLAAWQVQSVADFASLVPQGPVRVRAVAVDAFGNSGFDPVTGVSDLYDDLVFYLDTEGPRIRDVKQGSSGISVFRDSALRPDNLVSSLVVQLESNFAAPVDTNGIVAATLLGNPKHYQLVGDRTGNVTILAANPLRAANGTVVSVELVVHDAGGDGRIDSVDDVGSPLADDTYTLTVSDAITDWAGNALDGESITLSPIIAENGQVSPAGALPSGDRQPGGNFRARFTIDSRPEIGAWNQGTARLDLNGNGQFDPQATGAKNDDQAFRMGFITDYLFSGNFAISGAADGFDKLAAYGRTSSGWRWLIDTDNDGNADPLTGIPDGNIDGFPIAADFDRNPNNGDEVGVFTGSTWHLDTNHNFRVADNGAIQTAMRGFPIAGDFDGDGIYDLGTYRNDVRRFEFSLSSRSNGVPNGAVHRILYSDISGVLARPVAADMNQDGITDIGLWSPANDGSNTGNYFFWVSANGQSVLNRVETGELGPTVPFTPQPFGPDLFYQFDVADSLPLVGNFDPPVFGKQVGVANADIDQVRFSAFDATLVATVGEVSSLHLGAVAQSQLPFVVELDANAPDWAFGRTESSCLRSRRVGDR